MFSRLHVLQYSVSNFGLAHVYRLASIQLLSLCYFCRAFEDATLLKLKQAADRARAIQQLQTEQPDQ
jgi:hypothetical protein